VDTQGDRGAERVCGCCVEWDDKRWAVCVWIWCEEKRYSPISVCINRMRPDARLATFEYLSLCLCDAQSNNLTSLSMAASSSSSVYRGAGFDFSNSIRNEFLESKGVALPKATSTGTTIVGCLFQDGIVLGADTRATSGPIVADKNCEKVCCSTDERNAPADDAYIRYTSSRTTFGAVVLVLQLIQSLSPLLSLPTSSSMPFLPVASRAS